MTAIADVPVIARAEERLLAERASRELAPLASKPLRVRIDGTRKTVTLPASAVRLLADLLAQMARGNAVSLMSHRTELTTQRAADFLGVSRPFLVGLLEGGKISFRKVGAHRRVLLKDLLAYKKDTYSKRRKALEELTALDQELGLY